MFTGTGTEQTLHYKIYRNRKLSWTETGTGTETETEINTYKTDKKNFDWLTHNFFYTLKKNDMFWRIDALLISLHKLISMYTTKKNVIKIIHKIQKLFKISANIWTKISAGTETGISVPVPISAGTGTKPNFGRSLIIMYKTVYLIRARKLNWHCV